MTEQEERLLLDRQLCFPLYAAARRIVSEYTPLLRPLNLTYTQYLVFLALWEEDSQSVGALCRRLRLDSGTLTPLLKKLEADGRITRSRSPKDERSVTVSLTESGRALKEQALDIPVRAAACVPLSPEDAGTLYSLLYKILDQEAPS